MDRREPASIRVGEWVVDAADGFVTRGEERRPVRPKIMALLVLLARSPGRTVTKDEIFDTLWRGHVVEEGALARCMFELRELLDDDARHPRYIETRHRRGYVLIAPVEVAPRSERRIDPRSRLRLAAAAAILAMGVITLAVLAAVERGGKPRPSIALLELCDLRARSDDAWLRFALAEMLASELANDERVRVIPASWTLGFERDRTLDDQPPSLEEVAAVGGAVGASLALTGCFATVAAPDGERIRLDLRVHDTAQGKQLATAAGHGPKSELFDLVARLGAQLRGQLGVGSLLALADAAEHRGLPRSAEGTRLYALGLAALHRFEVSEACELLGDAAAVEPGAARVHAALARCWSEAGYDARAAAAATRAQRLASTLTREQRMLIDALSLEMARDWAAARAVYQRLQELFPDTVEHGLRYAAMTTALGRPDRALESMTRLADRIPSATSDPRLYLGLAEAARARGDLERQRDAAQQAAALGGRFGARTLRAQAHLLEAEALHHLGAVEPARAAAAEARALLGDKDGGRLLAAALVHRLDTIDAQATGFGLGYEEALGIFRAAGDRLGIARTLVKVARGEAGVDPDLAETRLDEALAIAREIGNLRVRAEALNALAIVAHARADGRLSVARFEAAAAAARASGDRILTAGILANLAGEMDAMGRSEPAQPVAEEAVAIARHVGSRFLFAMTLIKAGAVASGVGQLAVAERRMAEALEIARGIEDRRLENIATTWLGGFKIQRGEVEAGLALSAQAIAAWEDFGNIGMADWARLTIANVELESGELEAAAGRFQTVLAHDEATTAMRGLANAGLAEVATARGDLVRARAQIDALPAAETFTGWHRLLVERATIRLYSAEGRHDLALVLAGDLIERSRASRVGERLGARFYQARALLAAGDAEAGRAALARLAEDAARFEHAYLARMARRDAGMTEAREQPRAVAQPVARP